MKKQGVANHVRSTYTTVMSIGYGWPTYNTHRPPTMLFTIGLSERAILVIRLKIDLRITQVQELTLRAPHWELTLRAQAQICLHATHCQDPQ